MEESKSKTIKIADKKIGEGQPVFVIAEAGLNHQGELEIAKKLVDAAGLVGADCIKFQKRKKEKMLTKAGLDKPYTGPNSFGPTYGEHRDALELSEDEHRELKKYCDEKGIIYGASVWDEESAEFIDSLANAGIDYSLLLIPGEESRVFLQKVIEYNLDYAVLINDEMEDRFSIDADDTKNMIKNSVVNLISVYGRNTVYIVDPNSDLFNSVIFNFIRDEFTQRDIELSSLVDYSSLLGKEFNDVVSLFNFYCDSGKSEKPVRLIMDYNTFTRLKPLILLEKKKGTKFTVN